MPRFLPSAKTPTESERLQLFAGDDTKTKLRALRIVTAPQRLRAWAFLLTALLAGVAGALYNAGHLL